MRKYFLFIGVIVTIWMTGCVQNIQNIENISSKGVTLRVSEDELSSRLEDIFPIVDNLPYGEIELTHPKAILKKGSNRVIAGTTVSYSNDVLAEQQGSLYLSGAPFFNAQTGEIFLRAPKIEQMKFNGVDLFDYVKKPLIDALQPMINELFAKNPIYVVDRSKFMNSFIKNVSVDDGSLLITFGF